MYIGRSIFIFKITREENKKVDLLSKLANDNPVDLLNDMWIEVLNKLSIEEETGTIANI